MLASYTDLTSAASSSTTASSTATGLAMEEPINRLACLVSVIEIIADSAIIRVPNPV
jgi:hypothetical protein